LPLVWTIDILTMVCTVSGCFFFHDRSRDTAPHTSLRRCVGQHHPPSSCSGGKSVALSCSVSDSRRRVVRVPLAPGPRSVSLVPLPSIYLPSEFFGFRCLNLECCRFGFFVIVLLPGHTDNWECARPFRLAVFVVRRPANASSGGVRWPPEGLVDTNGLHL